MTRGYRVVGEVGASSLRGGLPTGGIGGWTVRASREEAIRSAPMTSRLRQLAHEPLVHFVLIGVLLAVLEWVAGGGATSADARTLVVDDATRRGLAEDFEHEHGRAPSEAELAPIVESWVDQEVLYREGLLRGLDRDDVRVRQRVVSLMAARVEAEHPIDDPTEEEIRAYFDAHADRYAEESRLDFTHVYVEGTDEAAEARARTLLTTLAEGGSPIGLGDTFTGGRTYRGRRIVDLVETFGPGFVEGIDAQALGSWALRRSRTGVHLVRIERRTAASEAAFDRARLDVEHDLMEEARRERSRRALDELRARWEIAE